VTLFINVISVFRVTRAAHNGLVAGSSPAGPTTLPCFIVAGLEKALSVHDVTIADGALVRPG